MNDEDKLDIAVSIGAAIAAPSPVTFATTGWKVLRALIDDGDPRVERAVRLGAMHGLPRGQPPTDRRDR